MYILQSSRHSRPQNRSLLGTDTEALFLHEVDRTLLHRIERTIQGGPAIDRVRKIILEVVVDLIDGRPPREIGIHLRGRLLEYWEVILIAKVRLGAVQHGRI